MNAGMFGFPVGPTVTYRVEEYASSGTFVPSRNCQFVWVEMCGGGGGGGNGTAAGALGVGGCGGLYWSGIIMASELGTATTVTIGAGGSGGIVGGAAATNGSATSLANVSTGTVIMQASGGRAANATGLTVTGGTVFIGYGHGGSGQGIPGAHGGNGPGGGGAASNSSTDGAAGGRPSSFASLSAASAAADRGGGAAGGTSSGPGADATAALDVRGFGAGGGGGGGSSVGVGAGGKGRRGGGGGGGGGNATFAAGANGGDGGSGFCRIVEVRFG